jgi:hypothetical protein
MADVLGRQFTITDLGGRRRRLLATIHDQRYLASGFWSDVVEDFAADGVDGFARQANRMRHALRVAEDGTRRWHPRRDQAGQYVELGRPQYWTGSAWNNLPLGTPAVTGTGFVWDRPQFSLSLAHNWHRTKLEVVLKSSAAARRFRWPVSLQGLQWNQWRLLADGAPVAYVEPVRGWDANGAPVALSMGYAGGFLEVGGDLAGAAYPVTIDPTLTVQPDGAAGLDSYILSADSGSNRGTDAAGGIGEYFSGEIQRVLMAFDLTDLPADATIDGSTATLSTWLAQSGNNRADNNRTLTLHRLKVAWSESQVTWNVRSTGNNWQTAGATGANDYESTGIGSCAFATADSQYAQKDWAITASNKAALDLGYGWLLRSPSDDQDRYIICLSDHATAGYRPKLVVNYSEAAAGGKPWYVMGWQ